MKFLHKNLPKWIRWVVLSSSSWNLHCQHQTMDEDNRPCGLRAALLGGGVSDPARLSESADGPTTGGCLWPHRCVNGWRKRRGLYDIYMEWWGWYFWIFEKPLRLRLMGPAHPIFFCCTEDWSRDPMSSIHSSYGKPSFVQWENHRTGWAMASLCVAIDITRD